MEIKDLLMLCIERQASDLHVTEDEPPILRVDGQLLRTDFKPLNRLELKKLIYSILTNAQKEAFEKNLELDFSFSQPGMDRFRVNIHIQRGSVEAAFRRVPLVVPTMEELGLPQVIKELASKPNGLVLFTGPTGVGKTTTLAAIVNFINEEKEKLIISIEDPIEFIHANKKSVINQLPFGYSVC